MTVCVFCTCNSIHINTMLCLVSCRDVSLSLGVCFIMFYVSCDEL